MYAGISHLYDLNFREALGSLGEAGKCGITGEPSDSVILVPVDGNSSNRLLSNLAYVLPEYAKKWSLTIGYTIHHEIGALHFVTPIEFKSVNEARAKEVNFWDFNTLVEGFALSEEKLVLLWDYLTQHHVKGLHKIDVISLGVSVDVLSMVSWRAALSERKRILSGF